MMLVLMYFHLLHFLVESPFLMSRCKISVKHGNIVSAHLEKHLCSFLTIKNTILLVHETSVHTHIHTHMHTHLHTHSCMHTRLHMRMRLHTLV